MDDELRLPNASTMDLTALPKSFQHKLEGGGHAWSPDGMRRAFFKSQVPGVYESLDKAPNVHGRTAHNKACLEYMFENLLSLKMQRGEVKWNHSKTRFEPATEGINATVDVTNFAYVQLQMLKKIYFSNAFVNLISVQPARTRSGTYFTFDIKKPEDANKSIFEKSDFDVTYADYTEGGDPNSLKMTIGTDTFTTTERSLHAEVEDMLQQDLSAEYGMDAFQELMPYVTSELAKIESTKILDALLAQSGNFSDAVSFNQNGASTEDNKTVSGQKSYGLTIVDTINGVGRKIQKNIGVLPTWLYMDINTFGYIQDQLESSFKDSFQDNLVSITGASLDNLGRDNTSVQWRGILKGNYDIYVDNSGHTGLQNKIIVGSTSPIWLYQGATYHPFVLGWAPGRLRSYDKIFRTKEGVMNRTGIKINQPKFFGQITLTTS
jgi:hypothetical protein